MHPKGETPLFQPIRDYAKEKGIHITTAVGLYIQGDLPDYVGRIPYHRRKNMSRARWQKLNGISKESAARIQRHDRLPPYVTNRGKAVLPSGELWWEDSQEWVRIATVLRHETGSSMALFKRHEAARRYWQKRIPEIRKELKQFREQMKELKYYMGIRWYRLRQINDLVRQGLKARERGVLFLEEDNARILADARRQLELNRKRSLGLTRFNELRRQAALEKPPAWVRSALTSAPQESTIAPHKAMGGMDDGGDIRGDSERSVAAVSVGGTESHAATGAVCAPVVGGAGECAARFPEYVEADEQSAAGDAPPRTERLD